MFKAVKNNLQKEGKICTREVRSCTVFDALCQLKPSEFSFRIRQYVWNSINNSKIWKTFGLVPWKDHGSQNVASIFGHHQNTNNPRTSRNKFACRIGQTSSVKWLLCQGLYLFQKNAHLMHYRHQLCTGKYTRLMEIMRKRQNL